MKIKNYFIVRIAIVISFLLTSSVYVEALPSAGTTFIDASSYDKGVKVSMDFENAALRDILKSFSRQTGINFIASDIIEGKKITVFLNNVSVEEALGSILEANELAYEKQAGNVYLIKPSGKEKLRMITKVYKLNYIQVYRMDAQQTPATSSSALTGQSSSTSGTTIIAPSTPLYPPAGGGGPSATAGEGDAPKNIIALIHTLMSKNGKIVADRRNNSLLITDIPEVFPNIEEALKELDVEPMQIMIQAELIETTIDTLKRLGIEYGDENFTAKLIWGKGGTSGSGQNPVMATPFPLTQDALKTLYNATGFNPSTASASLFKYGTLTAADTSILLKLFARDSDTRLLSRPKIMTINNEPAIIKVTSNTAIGIDSISVTQTSQVIQKAERVETGILLKVIPQANSKGDIFLYIEPSVARAEASLFFTTQFLDPQMRSSASTVMIRDGDTVLIGGLIKTDNFKTTTKVPILGDIPLIGEPFKSRFKHFDDTELLIFITPHIVKKRDREYVTPEEMTDHEYMIQKTLAEYSEKISKKNKTKLGATRNGKETEKEAYVFSGKDAVKREENLNKVLGEYSKNSAPNTKPTKK